MDKHTKENVVNLVKKLTFVSGVVLFCGAFWYTANIAINQLFSYFIG